MIKHIKDNDYETEVLNKKGIILVDFYAKWCGPCMMLSPILEEISNSRGEYNIVKVNVDECPDVTSKLKIDTIPTMIIYKDGKIVDKYIGLRGKDEIVEILENFK